MIDEDTYLVLRQATAPTCYQKLAYFFGGEYSTCGIHLIIKSTIQRGLIMEKPYYYGFLVKYTYELTDKGRDALSNYLSQNK